MKYDDIKKMKSADIDKLSFDDMKEVAKIVTKTANARIETFNKHNRSSPALEQLKKRNGENIKFSTKGQNRNELRNTISSALNFTESQTGSYNKIIKIEKNFFNNYLGEDVPKDTSDFWKLYREYAQEHSNLVATKLGSETVLKALTIIYNNADTSNQDIINDEDLSETIFNYLENQENISQEEIDEKQHIKW